MKRVKTVAEKENQNQKSSPWHNGKLFPPEMLQPSPEWIDAQLERERRYKELRAKRRKAEAEKRKLKPVRQPRRGLLRLFENGNEPEQK